MSLLFTSAITLAFTECQRELERLSGLFKIQARNFHDSLFIILPTAKYSRIYDSKKYIPVTNSLYDSKKYIPVTNSSLDISFISDYSYLDGPILVFNLLLAQSQSNPTIKIQHHGCK